jgi:Holliday junction resolvase
MVNKKYVCGTRFEYKVKKFFNGIGAEVVRSAGSHGIDLVVMFPSPISQNWLISCKVAKYVNHEERCELHELSQNYKNDGVFIAYPLRGMICLNPVK